MAVNVRFLLDSLSLTGLKMLGFLEFNVNGRESKEVEIFPS